MLVATPITWVIYAVLLVVIALSVRAAVTAKTRQDV